jgi:hypothetical protein
LARLDPVGGIALACRIRVRNISGIFPMEGNWVAGHLPPILDGLVICFGEISHGQKVENVTTTIQSSELGIRN